MILAHELVSPSLSLVISAAPAHASSSNTSRSTSSISSPSSSSPSSEPLPPAARPPQHQLVRQYLCETKLRNLRRRLPPAPARLFHSYSLLAQLRTRMHSGGGDYLFALPRTPRSVVDFISPRSESSWRRAMLAHPAAGLPIEQAAMQVAHYPVPARLRSRTTVSSAHSSSSSSSSTYACWRGGCIMMSCSQRAGHDGGGLQEQLIGRRHQLRAMPPVVLAACCCCHQLVGCCARSSPTSPRIHRSTSPTTGVPSTSDIGGRRPSVSVPPKH